MRRVAYIFFGSYMSSRSVLSANKLRAAHESREKEQSVGMTAPLDSGSVSERELVGGPPSTLVDDPPTVELTTSSEIHAELSPGSVLRSRYVLDDVIGRGGTSILFRAKDLHRASSQDTANFVAIKLLRPERRADPRALTHLKR